ncbi:cupin [Mycolicibacterium sp. GF69]|uniref:cupin n=1 Tax=Mycolicibacterium sp. GF69 TaxID=2267251 RepID=UPI000DCD92BF|nr:cupin [Mycolicibacterium sp. GF69]RAV17181.1 cupin [Mycolicibacterium sp. GF69]
MTVSPIDLYSVAFRLPADGRAQTIPRVFDVEQSGWFVMAAHAETDADVHGDHWEVHPQAEELVVCLRGAFRMFIRARESDAEDEISVPGGAAVIVPRGHWHRIELDEPSDLLSATVLDGTRLAARTNP